MARRKRRRPGPRPWHRPAAVVGLLGAVALATWALVTVQVDDRTSWAKHVTGAALALVALGGVSGIVVAPRAAGRVLVVIGWTLPASLVWLGLEHWLNWFAFYEPRGRHKVTTETGARVQGSFLVVLGAGGLAFIAYLARAARASRSRT